METKFRVEKVVHKEVDTGGEELDESTTVLLAGDVISITIRGPSVELDNEFVPPEKVELVFKRPQKTLSTFEDVDTEEELAKEVEKEFAEDLDREEIEKQRHKLVEVQEEEEPVISKPQKKKGHKDEA